MHIFKLFQFWVELSQFNKNFLLVIKADAYYFFGYVFEIDFRHFVNLKKNCISNFCF
jgi:hypothetical protein